MNIYDYKIIADEFNKKFEIVKNKFVGLDVELLKLDELQQDPAFWEDFTEATKISKRKKVIEKKLDNLKKTELAIADFITIIELSGEDVVEDFSEIDEYKANAEKMLSTLWIETLLNKEYDDGPAILTFHSGAGGEEAQDWAEMIARMYTRYAEKRGWSVQVLDYQAGDGAGIKSETILVEGDFAYGYLRTEQGVHRLVRLSPYDANNRRHTSFASLEVSPFVDDTPNIDINPSDLKIDTYRSSGAGGQHVNKTESAIRITHIPSGIVVQCQNERSQIQNREMAMKMLYSKLLEKDLAEKERQRQLKLGENKKIEWGSQIRSYILHPYNLVKDHRTNYETSNSGAVLDGEIQEFINEFLKVEQ
ncbi:MAG: peptide chain release factor 2 [Clostridia bacterium]|nr:peptide chain release factor 2 [Clostridia bacterium]